MIPPAGDFDSHVQIVLVALPPFDDFPTFMPSVASIDALSSQTHGCPAGCAFAPLPETGDGEPASTDAAGVADEPAEGEPAEADDGALEAGAFTPPVGLAAPVGAFVEPHAAMSKTIRANPAVAKGVPRRERTCTLYLRVSHGEDPSLGLDRRPEA